MKERKCPECGKAFAPGYGSQVCCGEECRAERERRLRHNKNLWAKIVRERREKTDRRREFFAARDAAFENAGLPIPKIETFPGRTVESRGQIPGGTRV